ncbi:putative bifunctional diguanylate cyclase/phosphodiesterase [Dyella lutea]|uniref:EAL domain-containing protein n=1 Tax=Dyella lutea TaxID=2950441 RepID=A0ABT1F8J1_9GAMM|nr:EAL domain-containing protein [Dyella lutea]MCP1372778.1 EAL domain-containing protein [Dyella lutea]
MALPHNLWLPALLGALATLHAYLALDTIPRVAAARGAVAMLWLGFGAAVLAVGVWTTQYLGHAGTSGLGGARAAVAGGIAWASAVLALCQAARGRAWLAGILLGTGLVLATTFDQRLDRPGMASCLACMLLLGAGGAMAALAWRERRPPAPRVWSAAVLLGLTIAALPVAGNALAPDAAMRPPAQVPGAAAFVISALVLLLAAVVQLAQRELARQAAQIRGELESARQALVHQAFHDALTALPNRAKVLAQLQELLPEARRDGQDVAVMFIDLDGFKSINDTLGHEAGDEFLRRVAEALSASVRPRDTVARFGGDEFVVVLERFRNRENLGAICEKILARVGAPVLVAGQKVTATPSIGVAVFPDDGAEPTELLRHADIAMYAAKERGKAGFCFYEPQMIARASERLALSTDLREGLGRDELRVCYQPKVDLRSRRLVGLEALARWAHPTRGHLPPSMFIPLAEDCGLIARLGERVVREVAGQIARWRAEGLPLVPVAINLSMQEIQGVNFVPSLLRTLAEAGLDRHAIEFEITETAAMTDVHTTLRHLRELEALGFRIAIDDFGTGFSSLSHLRQLPARTIKIDQSFVHGADASHHDREITEAIIALARKLRLHTVAEGVESEQQARWLVQAGCDIGQGYLFGRPLPPGETATLLAAGFAGAPIDA